MQRFASEYWSALDYTWLNIPISCQPDPVHQRAGCHPFSCFIFGHKGLKTDIDEINFSCLLHLPLMNLHSYSGLLWLFLHYLCSLSRVHHWDPRKHQRILIMNKHRLGTTIYLYSAMYDTVDTWLSFRGFHYLLHSCILIGCQWFQWWALIYQGSSNFPNARHWQVCKHKFAPFWNSYAGMHISPMTQLADTNILTHTKFEQKIATAMTVLSHQALVDGLVTWAQSWSTFHLQ